MTRVAYIDDMESWQKDFHFYLPIKVRFSETDMFGHLNNTVPFIYFEQARIDLFQSLGFMQDWTKPDHDTIPVVADLQCDFLSQVFFDEHIKLYAKVAEIGNSSMDIHYMGCKGDGNIAFTGRGRIVQISKKTGKSVPLSEEMLEKLKESKYGQKAHK